MENFSKETIDKTFGIVFKEYRIKTKMTQAQLAEELDVSEKFISRVETGKSGVRKETLINYINLLGIPPAVIYKEFINNEELKAQIELVEKAGSLSTKQIEFLCALIEILPLLK